MPPEKLSNIIYALIIIMHTCTKMNTQYWHNLQNFMKQWQKLQILYKGWRMVNARRRD